MVEGESGIQIPRLPEYKDSPIALTRYKFPSGRMFEAVSFQQDGIRYVLEKGELKRLTVLDGNIVELPTLFPNFEDFIDRLQKTLEEQKPKGIILPNSPGNENQLTGTTFSQEEIDRLETILNSLKRRHKRLVNEAENFFDN